MSDLYTGLINPKLRKGMHGERFWGAFNGLDNPGPPSTNFLAIQIAGLQILEQGKSKKYKAANEFLKQAQSKLSNQPSVEDAVTNEVYNRIMELMNSGLRGSMANPYRNVATKGLTKAEIQQNAQGEISKVLTELASLLKQIKASPEISTKIVEMLDQRLQTFDWQSKTPHSYIMEKADLAEALMVEQMNQNPALRAVVTGAWIDMSGQQLIEDAFAFSPKNISIPFAMGKLNYSIITSKGTESKSASSIQEFLASLDQLNGTKFKVQLSDELYAALQEGAALAGQAKSGLSGQNILNKAKRNALTLQDVEFNPMALWDLYNADLQTRTEYFKPEGSQNSKTLEALANYCLSKNIAKTALAKNQVYLTSDGFVTASQWMKQYSRYLIFTPGVTSVSGDFLTKSRPYYFNA